MKIGILFSGYGGQYVGMGKDMYDDSRTMQEFFEEAANCLGINFVKLCFASSGAELSQIQHAYLSIFTVSSALYTILQQETGIEPDLVAGMGVGEYSALLAARSISFPDGLYLINKYALAFEELLLSQRLGVFRVTGISVADLKKLINSTAHEHTNRCVISSYLADTDFYLSGVREGLAHIQQLIHDQYSSAQVIEIDEGHGINSSIMDPIVENIRGHLHQVDFKDLAVPMINGVDGACIKKGESAKYSIMRHINEPIVWNQVLENFVGSDIIMVIGPGTELVKIAQDVYPDKTIFSVNSRADIDEIKRYVQGMTVDGDTDR